MLTAVPYSALSVCVFKLTFETAAIDANASPRKPSEAIAYKSSSLFNLLVAWRRNAVFASSSSMPTPLSATRIYVIPPSTISIAIAVLCASIEFSTSSFITEAGRSTTSPAAILFDISLSNTIILLISVRLVCVYYFVQME